MLEKLFQSLPKLRNKFALTGVIVAVGGVVAIETITPSNISAQASAGAMGVSFIVFGQVFHYLNLIPEKDRVKYIITMFFGFLIFTLSLISTTAYFVIKEYSVNNPFPLSINDKMTPEKLASIDTFNQVLESNQRLKKQYLNTKSESRSRRAGGLRWPPGGGR